MTTHPMLDDAHSFNWTRICDYTDCQAVAHILLPDDYGDRRSCTLPAHIQAMYDAHAFDASMAAAVRDGRSHAVRGMDGRWSGTDAAMLDRLTVTRWAEQ